jgi:hypothetical protein
MMGLPRGLVAEIWQSAQKDLISRASPGRLKDLAL